MASRKIIHIVAGEDGWEPTEAELTKIATLFETAIVDGGPVVTRTGVQVQSIINIDDGEIAVVAIEARNKVRIKVTENADEDKADDE